MQQVGAAGLRQLPLDLEHDVKEDGFSDEDASEVVDWEQVARFGVELEALLARLLPNARTAWRPPLLPSRPSQRYVFVRCPVVHCDCNCFINMDKGMRALGHTLTAAGYGAVDLPAGAVRDVLTRPCAAADGAGPSPAAAAAAGMEAAERRSAEDGAGGGAEGREFVSWTELPRYVQMAIHKQGRWCWFASSDEDGGAYASLRPHLAFDHPDEGRELLQRLLVPGGQEEEEYRGVLPALWGSYYRNETLVAPDDPLVLELAEELARVVDDAWTWTALRKWSDDGVVVFGSNNDVQLSCPYPGCDTVCLVRMQDAYNSFKVALRAAVRADEMPEGPLREALVTDRGGFGGGRLCYHGWANLPRHAQLGFIHARGPRAPRRRRPIATCLLQARWRWFEEEWHTPDPYHGLRVHMRLQHAGDPEADRLRELLLDRKGEEEGAPDNPARQRMRELMADLEVHMEAVRKRQREQQAAAAAAGGDQDAAGGGAAGRAAPRGRRRW